MMASALKCYQNLSQEFGMAPLEGANIPLPPSVTSGPSRRTGQPSQKAPSVGNDVSCSLLTLLEAQR